MASKCLSVCQEMRRTQHHSKAPVSGKGNGRKLAVATRMGVGRFHRSQGFVGRQKTWRVKTSRSLLLVVCIVSRLVTSRTCAADAELPPRTLPTGPPQRPAVSWVQTDLRIAHLPPADWRQIQEFLKAGYQVIAVNTLEKWDHVGPRSNDYPAQVVKDADSY